jgi:hypothetical protein
MEAEKPPLKKPRNWLVRLLRFVLKFFVAILVVLYVLAGTAATKELYKRNEYRAQDISTLDPLLDEFAQNSAPESGMADGGDAAHVEGWIKARPLAETDKLIEIVSPKSAVLGPNVFFEFSRRELQLQKPEEAFFWMQLGRFRFLFDLIRCGADPDSTKVFDPVFSRMHAEQTDSLLRAHPEVLKKTAQRVLDFDAKYPAHDNPALICKPVSANFQLPTEELNWEGYRQLLRKHTAAFLKQSAKMK